MMSTTNRWSSKEVLNIGAMYSHWHATITNLVDVPFSIYCHAYSMNFECFFCMSGKFEPRRLSSRHEFYVVGSKVSTKLRHHSFPAVNNYLLLLSCHVSFLHWMRFLASQVEVIC